MKTLIAQADSIIRLEFYVGGFFGPSFQLSLTPEGYDARAWEVDELPLPRPCELKHTPTRFKRLIRRLFRHYGIARWRHSYTDPHTKDGTQWELVLHRAAPQKPLAFSGSNAYPPHYRRLLRLLAPYFHASLLPF